MSRKGEHEGRAIAALIFAIAFFMALYVLFLPPEDRSILLGEDINKTIESRTGLKYNELFSASPGLLTPEKEFGSSSSIGTINLFLKTEPKILKLANSLLISKSLVSSSSPRLNFDLDSSSDLDKVNFFFTIINEPSGVLKIKINGREFFSEASSRGVKIIEVPLTYLQERNTIELSVSNPGIFFWKKNNFKLQGVGIKQEYERINTKEERRFSVSQREKELIDEVSLNFYQFCNSPLGEDTAGLRLLLNDIEIFEGKIRCISTRHSIGIDPKLINAGTNSIIFSLDQGDFSFSEITLETKSEGEDFPTYIFQVSSVELKRIRDSGGSVTLELLLDSSEKNKNAIIRVNEGTIFMKTTSDKFEADITALLGQGSNFITIQPATTFTINGLKVFTE